MKLIRGFAILALGAAALLALPKAQADTNWGTMDVQVWVAPGSAIAQLPHPVPNAVPTYSFNYTGDLNFVNPNPNGGSNTFGDFFNIYSSGITNFLSHKAGVSSTTDFLAQLMSVPNGLGNNNGTCTTACTFMHFSGNFTNGMWFETVTSDDGSSLYMNGVNVVSMPQPQSPNSKTGVNTASSGTFDLVYIEANGSPAELVVTGATPEPGSLLLLGTGLLGLAVFVLRRAKQPMFMPRW